MTGISRRLELIVAGLIVFVLLTAPAGQRIPATFAVVSVAVLVYAAYRTLSGTAQIRRDPAQPSWQGHIQRNTLFRVVNGFTALSFLAMVAFLAAQQYTLAGLFALQGACFALLARWMARKDVEAQAASAGQPPPAIQFLGTLASLAAGNRTAYAVRTLLMGMPAPDVRLEGAPPPAAAPEVRSKLHAAHPSTARAPTVIGGPPAHGPRLPTVIGGPDLHEPIIGSGGTGRPHRWGEHHHKKKRH